jgi:hypothetical protein
MAKKQERIKVVFSDEGGKRVRAPARAVHPLEIIVMTCPDRRVVLDILARVWQEALDAYRPLGDFVCPDFSPKALRTVVRKHNVRVKRDSPQRPEVHAGDMMRALRLEAPSRLDLFDSMDTLDEKVIAYVAKVEESKQEAHALKDAEGATRRPGF